MMTESRDITGHVNTQVNGHITVDSPGPFQVEITNQPLESAPYTHSMHGTFHFEARNGFMLFVDPGSRQVRYLLGKGYLLDLIIETRSDQITMHDALNDTSHTLVMSEDQGITVEGFIEVLDAVQSGSRVSTPITHEGGDNGMD
jgi:hypothetical protein